MYFKPNKTIAFFLSLVILAQSWAEVIFEKKIPLAHAFSCGSDVSYDGQSYSTVQIGNQCWFAENLNVGTKVNGTTEMSDNASIEKYCYDNLTSNCDSYGGLYQWDEMMSYSTTEATQGICPSGWHVPTDGQWHTLENYLSTSSCSSTRTDFDCDPAGSALKSGGSSDFNALLSGYRTTNFFDRQGTSDYFWTSSTSGANAWIRYLESSESTIHRITTGKIDGLSVRCLKNPNTSPLAPDTLKTQNNTNPINLNSITPSFKATYRDDDSEDIATKYQIQINTSATFTGTTLWDSGSGGTSLSWTGCLVNTECEEITYAGDSLSGGTTYYWRIKYWDTGGAEGAWSNETASFSIETTLPKSEILYPQNVDDLKSLPKIIGSASDNQTGVDFVKISIKDNNTEKWYSGTGFVATTETWLMAQGSNKWSYQSPTWTEGNSYTIRSRATDLAGNEEKTAEATFTYDTTNGEEGSVYAESIRVSDKTNYSVYFPVTIALNHGDKFEIAFNSGAYAFTGSLSNSDITIQSANGSVTASGSVVNSTGTTITATLSGSVASGDVLEMHIQNNKILNPSSTWVYEIDLATYSGSTLLESGEADISISGQAVAIEVNLQETLVATIDSGSVLFDIDPDFQMWQNWVGTGGTVSQKTSVSVSTNNPSGYALRVALSGNTASGSAVLDGINYPENQLITGDAKNIENRFGWALTGSASTVNSFWTISSTTDTGIGAIWHTENHSNDIYYYLNVNYSQESDMYQWTVVYTVIWGI